MILYELVTGSRPFKGATRQELSHWVAFRDHLPAMLKHQDGDGCWHQAIDFPGSRRELSRTCKIALAMARGIREGWPDLATFEPAVRKAWWPSRRVSDRMVR